MPFKLGTYGHSLIIEVNNRYKLFEDADVDLRLLLSEGSWRKDGNELRLYDSSLDYSFLLLIRNDDLLKIRYPDNNIINGSIFSSKRSNVSFYYVVILCIRVCKIENIKKTKKNEK